MTTGEEVAIKLEPVKTKHPQLFYESRLYRVLSTGGKRDGRRRRLSRAINRTRARAQKQSAFRTCATLALRASIT